MFKKLKNFIYSDQKEKSPNVFLNPNGFLNHKRKPLVARNKKLTYYNISKLATFLEMEQEQALAKIKDFIFKEEITIEKNSNINLFFSSEELEMHLFNYASTGKGKSFISDSLRLEAFKSSFKKFQQKTFIFPLDNDTEDETLLQINFENEWEKILKLAEELFDI